MKHYYLFFFKHLYRFLTLHESGLEKQFFQGFVEHHRKDIFGPVEMLRALDGGATACLNLTGLEILRSLIGNDDNKQARKMIFSRATYQNAQNFVEQEAEKIAKVTVSNGAVAMDVGAALNAILSAVPHLEDRGITQEKWDIGIRATVPISIGHFFHKKAKSYDENQDRDYMPKSKRYSAEMQSRQGFFLYSFIEIFSLS